MFKKIFVFSIVTLMIALVLFQPIITADDPPIFRKGFDKGVSFENVVPLKKATFINYDEKSYLDDYAYLASVPSSVFYEEDNLYSHPLLFYQDYFTPEDEKELPLYSRSGIDFFMEDWISYCGTELDEIIGVNVPKNELYSWNSKSYSVIEGDSPIDIANEIALRDWSYSNDAVVSVISEDNENHKEITENKLKSSLPGSTIKNIPTINVKQTNSLNPVFEDFEVDDRYKFIKAVAWWDSIIFGGFVNVPTGDPDLQLYYMDEKGWMQTTAAAFYNLFGPIGYEITQAHVYKPGSWRIGVTDFPTEGEDVERKGIKNIFEIQGSILGMIKPGVTYHVDITLYPGIDITIPDNPPFGCRDVEFILSWNDPSANLAMSIIGPAGEAIFTEINESRTESLEIYFESLGECLPGESYSISVFSTKDTDKSVDFEIEYSWKQGVNKNEADSLTSATEGAVLASVKNAPLLYTESNNLKKSTIDVLYKLGVTNIYLVNIGNNIKKDVLDELKEIASLKHNFVELIDIYDEIKDITNKKDIIFSTINPWTYWYLGQLKPAGEKKGSLFIGPAAFIAAHHGAPVVIIDNHPRLSSAVTYHNEFWARFAGDRYENHPSTAEMVLTGERIYDFFDEYGFSSEGPETIVTVADQYDIGPSWDRIFPGVANAGRFCGPPVDISYWINRNIFYPAIIFSNPALQGPVELINGSVSTRKVGISIGKLGGFITKYDPLISINIGKYDLIRESGIEKFEFPVLCSFVTHKYRFNERASKYYGAKYESANGYIPGFSASMDSIDAGAISFHTDNTGAYYPDISETEVVPFYLEKGGFDVAYSTSLEAVVKNLNEGVLLWVHSSHGTEPNGGGTLFWNPEGGLTKYARQGRLAAIILNIGYKISKIPLIGTFIPSAPAAFSDDNPWRGYEWFLGSTDEPDTMSVDLVGILPYTGIRVPLMPAISQDWVISRKVVREFFNKLIPLIDPFRVDDLYDGVIGTVSHSRFTFKNYIATEIEENLENLHSAGFITGICQTSNTYMHLMLVRHGSVFQVQDPWPTSWYGAVWRQSIPRDIALGYTVGEAYTRGIQQVGILYLGGGAGADEPQWWWDDAEGVVYFGDPNLRMFVPGTEFSNQNNWKKPQALTFEEDLTIEGHSPFGATSHPREITPKTLFEKYLFVIIIIIIIVLLIIAMVVMGRRKK